MSLRKGNTLISGAGIDGTNGQDGFSPTASVSKVGNTSTLTVTDKNGTTTVEILDGGQYIQFSTMPIASASNVGDVIQFTGTTDSTYTNGYFYKCVENSGIYSWEYCEPIAEQSFTVIHSSTSPSSSFAWNDYRNACIKANKFLPLAVKYTAWGHYSGAILLPILDNGALIGFGGTILFKTGSGGVNLYLGYYKNDNNINISNVNNIPTTGNCSLGVYGGEYLPVNNTRTFNPTAGTFNPATAIYAEQMVQSVAPVYSSNSTYAIGDYVSYQGKLYVCSTTISSAEAWNSSHWTETTVMSIVGNLETALSNITTGNGV